MQPGPGSPGRPGDGPLAPSRGRAGPVRGGSAGPVTVQRWARPWGWRAAGVSPRTRPPGDSPCRFPSRSGAPHEAASPGADPQPGPALRALQEDDRKRCPSWGSTGAPQPRQRGKRGLRWVASGRQPPERAFQASAYVKGAGDPCAVLLTSVVASMLRLGLC